MKRLVRFGVVTVLMLGCVVLPLTLLLIKIPDILTWPAGNGHAHAINTMSIIDRVNLLVILILGAAGLLVILGVLLFSWGKAWIAKSRPPPPPAQRSPGGFTEIINSMNNSLDNLRALSAQIHEQTQTITRLCENFRKVRADQVSSFPVVSSPLAANKAANESGPKNLSFPVKNRNLTVSSQGEPDRDFFPRTMQKGEAALTEAETILIYLNQLKLNEEFGFFRKSRKDPGGFQPGYKT
jgi:hypothetical protein